AKEGFIAGADVEEFTRFKSPAEAMSFVRLGWDAFQALRELPFPTTAMVNGFCMGGGVELALACRYRVALDEPKTRFALPEVMLGIMPAWHGVQWLPKLVGPAAAFDMILTGKSVDAKRAKRIGLVDQAVALPRLERSKRVGGIAVCASDDGKSDPHFLPAGTDEAARQRRRLQGAARARGGRGRHGRRYRRDLRDARYHRHAAGHSSRTARAGNKALGGAVPAPAARRAPRARRDGPPDSGRRWPGRAPGRRDHRGDLRE